MITIIDCDIGNLRSVQKALEKSGAEVKISQKAEDITQADKIVLPGVGAIGPAMEKLNTLGLVNPLKEAVLTNTKPLLAICVGFQMLFEQSEEGGNIAGLGFLKGSVKRFQDLKVPQIGWNRINIQQSDCPLLNNIENGSHTYFCHSYYVQAVDTNDIATTTDYSVEYTSAVYRDNIFGVQFHPEKSQAVGLKILENFVQL